MRDKIGTRPESRKDRARLLVAGTVIGIVLARLFDPIAGRRRRAELRDRSAALARRSGRRAWRLARHTGSYAFGLKQRAVHAREAPKDLDDVTLTHKIESVIFRPADVPKGQINVNVQEGLVQLRGQVPRPEMIEDLESQVRRIQGVRDVENLLHPPGVEPRMHQ